MAARSIGSLTISFGLVAIPVKLYSATQSANAISFNLLHKTCGSRLKQQYVCQKEGVVVERDDMVKGYEFAKDQYVLFTPEEIKALEEVGTHAVEISEFVPIESIDPVYFDKTYYLAPDKGAAKPYALLTEALKQARPLRRRPLGRARQGLHRDPAPDRRCARHAAAALRQRRAPRQRDRSAQDGGEAGGAETRAAAHRSADRREVRSGGLQGRAARRASRRRSRRRSRKARRSRSPRPRPPGRARSSI